MSRYLTPAMIADAKLPKDFGVSRIKGTSMTIPGQGSDLAAIVQSIVKLPPLDERTFDVSANSEPDIRALQIKTDLDALYTPEGVNLAEEAKVRQNEREKAKNASDEKNAEHSDKADEE